ncbi:nucleotide exchange factor GrpE [Ruminococcaceae bacterium OttesenSCG-928-A16]|nr:nucleotide exchange factor GrpE [Ruminococcaceae bacterium OttesenSCG-928-A16]
MAEKNKQPPAEEKEPTKKANKGSKKEATGAAEIEAKLAAAEMKVEAAEQKVEEIKNSLLRTAAEYENYRKRSQKEQETAFGNGTGHAAYEMLPVLDTLDAAAMAESKDEEYKKGVLLTLTKCNEVFNKLGIHEIPALGEEFNPELHNAVMQLPAEGAASGTITQVMQKGYTLNGRVIRHAMVAVAP